MPSATTADLTQRAQTLSSAGDLVGAQRVLASALDPADATDPRHADADLALAAALHARLLIALGDPHSARLWAAYAHEAEERLHGPHDERTLGAAATHAAVLQRVGHYGKAAQVYQALVAELSAREGPDAPRVLAAEADLATAEHAAGHCQSARARLTDAWTRHRAQHGDAAPAGIKMLARLGAMERECARDAESREHLALAQELCARYLPADHPLVRQVAALATASATGRHVCGRVEQSTGPQQPAPRPGGPIPPAPQAVDPHPADPHRAGPHPGDPQAGDPNPAGPFPGDPQADGSHPAGPHPAALHPGGPLTADPQAAGPHPAALHPGGPLTADPQAADPHSGGPHPADLHPGGPLPGGPEYGDARNGGPQNGMLRDSRPWDDGAYDDEHAEDDTPTVQQVPFPRRPGVPDPGGDGFPPDADPLRPPPDNRPTDPNGTVYQQPLYLADVHQAPGDLIGRHARADTPPPLPGHRAPDYGPDGRPQPIGSAPASTLATPPNSERLLPVRTEQPVTGRGRQPFLLVAVLIAGIAVAIAIVALTLPDADGATGPQPTAAPVITTTAAGPSATPTVASSATAPPVGDPGAPSGVKLRDNRDSVALSWAYPKDAEGPVLVSGGRAGQQLRAFQQLPAGTADYMVYGLNPDQNYCFTVAVAYATDRIAASAPVCTRR
ncbi:fibronectin type III domain-containing protein [Paractinoplanes toevensis]|nr:fibronectin type III domain-containing protein [Actinoplanes toevensis]